MVNKAKMQDVSKSKKVEKFLISKQLKRVACKCQTDSENRIYYVQFSFDDCIIENATMRKRLK